MSLPDSVELAEAVEFYAKEAPRVAAMPPVERANAIRIALLFVWRNGHAAGMAEAAAKIVSDPDLATAMRKAMPRE